MDENVIVVADNSADELNYVPGNMIEFATGIRCEITEVEKKGYFLYVTYESEQILDSETGGPLDYARVYDKSGALLINSIRSVYESQYGLHGKVFRILVRNVPVLEKKNCMRLMCAFAMAMVATMICILIAKKYDLLFGIVFYGVFALSPWVVGFASNVYWLEALLFLPMVIGLLCSIWYEKKWIRVISYIGVFGAIFIKSLCGYEYVTVVMMSSIVFLLTDLCAGILKKEKKEKLLLVFRTIFLIGIFALAGFGLALIIHARLRGGGDILNGLKSIYEQDVLRRTFGGNAANFDPVYAESFNASVLSVLATYFDFNNSVYVKQVLLGINGGTFPILAAGSFVIVIIRKIRKTISWEGVMLYIWLFISCISWFVFGKAHSAIHTHLNFLMWYFGYVQIAIYMVCRGIYDIIKKRVKLSAGDKNRITE